MSVAETVRACRKLGRTRLDVVAYAYRLHDAVRREFFMQVAEEL